MKKIVLLFLFGLTASSFADELQKAYQEARALAQSHANQSIDALKALDITKFPGYQPNLPQQNYYQGVTQEVAGIELPAQTESKKSDSAKTVNEAINNRPQQKVDIESTSMQNLNKIANEADEIIHGEAGIGSFCLDGHCSPQTYDPANDADFKRAISMLSAASSASKDIKGLQALVFSGLRLECSTLMLGAKNCCRESGWGIDLNLFHCTPYEKILGKARENKLTIATGEYCYKRKKWPGGSKCIEHHQTFCVFESKLARIVQEQGRRNQLGIGFGEGQYTNCIGLAPNILQLIHFDLIDFGEFFADINTKIKSPDQQNTSENLKKRFQDFYNQGGTHG